MKPTVLLVEDDENDVFFMRRAFSEAGISDTLNVVADGREAINYLSGEGQYQDRGNSPLPSLVLLDLKLPYVLGLDVLKWIRAKSEFNGVIVAILTSSKEHRDIEQAYAHRANSYLVKPSDAKGLLQMVRRIKEYWIETNQSAPIRLVMGRGERVQVEIV